MRVTTKEVKHVIDGEEMTFQIRKMDALHGSYLMKFVAEKFLPMFTDVKSIVAENKPDSEKDIDKAAEIGTEEFLNLIPKVMASISEEDLIKFETRCLNTVDILKPAGWQPVMTGDRFGVEEIENDVLTVLLLCYEVVEFNLGSFFGEKSLGSFLTGRNS